MPWVVKDFTRLKAAPVGLRGRLCHSRTAQIRPLVLNGWSPIAQAQAENQKAARGSRARHVSHCVELRSSGW